MKNRLTFLIYIILFLSGCVGQNEKKMEKLVKEWNGRMIVFPDVNVFVSLNGDTVRHSIPKADFYILTYVDSIGCVSCKLQLKRWKQYIADLRLIEEASTEVLFFMGSIQKREIKHILEEDKFVYPICFDENDYLNKLNHFPSNMAFQTFLLDRNYKVLSIGNPIHNAKVRDLYDNIIQGEIFEKGKSENRTKLLIKESIISLGHFNWKKEQNVNFTICNIGEHPLVINDVTTSCGCTSVDYPKEPVCPGDSISLQVTYKADKPEHFNKTITVYCNANPSLVHLKIVGEAE